MTAAPHLEEPDLEESAIRLVTLTDVWPPLGQEQATGPALSDAGLVKPLPLEHEPGPTLEQGPVLPRQFALLLAEVLAGVRPARQLTPWLSKRGSVHLHRLMPLFAGGRQPRVLRVLTTRPAPDVVEMTLVVVAGGRTRALAARLERAEGPQRWLCTDIEAA
jgi:hypothetical protein